MVITIILIKMEAFIQDGWNRMENGIISMLLITVFRARCSQDGSGEMERLILQTQTERWWKAGMRLTDIGTIFIQAPERWLMIHRLMVW